MQSPLVSILISNHNYGRFLRQAIDSALAQTYADCQVVVVDDGSTDDSRQIIDSYGPRITAVLKANGGQASAVNTGMPACRGDIVCLLDSDDLYVPEKVAQVVELARRFPPAVVLHHPVQQIDAAGHPIRRPRPHAVMTGDLARRTRRSGGLWAYPPTSGLAFTRAALERMLPIPEPAYRTCADLYLATLGTFLGPVAGIRRPLSLYRLHQSNNWLNADASEPDASTALRVHLRRHETQVRELNAALQRLGLDERVQLEDHLPYRLLRYRLGEGDDSLAKLAGLALRWPGESFAKRMKMLLRNAWPPPRRPRLPRDGKRCSHGRPYAG